MPWPKGRPRDPATNAKVGRPGRKHPDDCNHCATLRGKPSGNSGKQHSFTTDNEYKRIHTTVVTVRGRPSACMTCGTVDGVLDWALNHAKPSASFRQLEDDRWVSDDVMDYIPLCRFHHVQFDQAGIKRSDRRKRVHS